MATFNHRITLQQPASGEDAVGQPLTGWVDVAQLWADVRQLSGLQAIKGDARVSAVQASVRIWRRAGVVAGMRVLHAGATYAVRAVTRAGRDFDDLVCEVVT
jgi:SPP1 family predicted phage head-tail adaptor